LHLLKDALVFTMTNWQRKFFGLSDHIATWSKDSSTKVASIIVDDDNDIVSVGYNGFPRGVNDYEYDGRHDRPKKYLYTEHGERNAIYSAAKKGVALKGCILYTRWFCCADCARAAIQVGIKEIVCEKPKGDSRDKRWKESMEAAKIMLIEAGVKITYV
jgi:dCMP deaminase